jgi:hypothetical protein
MKTPTVRSQAMLLDTMFPLGDADEFVHSAAERSRYQVKNGDCKGWPAFSLSAFRNSHRDFGTKLGGMNRG